jgi:histidinol dehydrogenase
MSKRLQMKTWKAPELPTNWFLRIQEEDKSESQETEEEVKLVIKTIVENGEKALTALTAKYEGVQITPEDRQVTKKEIKKAYKAVTPGQITALRLIKEKVGSYERLIKDQINVNTLTEGISIRITQCPIESVGCYVPGGLAAYPSTLVMTTVPAKVAGVPRIIVCSPPNKQGEINPLILVAADICEVNEIYKVGGAQAIAAMAYGTENIKPVKKIVGPGNKYVTTAKILVAKDVAIDMPAGPSEILVLADETANPRLIALDMISQAEHGVDSVAGLITTSNTVGRKVLEWLEKIVQNVERREIVAEALEKHGFIIECENIDRMIELANVFAPEHVEIVSENPGNMAEKIKTAGLILIGPYSPVALSDYGSGTNHVLPTGGFAQTYSGLSVLDFMRRINIVESSREGLKKLEKHVKIMTDAEKLPNHYKAVKARFEIENQE